ncbi:MAG: hypothetical protein RL172_1892 [Bacteroidota bacterium]|jgi:hypothetical protein
MLKKIIAIISITCIAGCGNTDSVPNTDIDVARAFIKGVQENKFKQAGALVLQDETNTGYISQLERFYKQKSAEELEKYKSADIIVNEITAVNDTVTIINYSNSYKKQDSNKLKMIKRNGQWQVDLKYTFSGNL